ncbi:thaumatin-like protein [Fomitiporia mediterranea MF3/22]|uniref:thaumatin-like protein n=1 Tax=Fomitiporia mediterranea (strain MF3/22) TaxID=694068 RepID=UPI000440883E|nr:thaumatin-like protein [Fomitiporia mediterranea MF3/22]EJD04867.1 thaumatin-like protein [Fomitiporia mediterranea MF3/22]
MVFKIYVSGAFLAFVTGASARTFTVKNNCSFTVWPAIFTDLNVGKAVPDQPTGWEAASETSVSFTVPDNWKAGRIWGRRECDFSTVQGPTSCVTGGCNGGLLCNNSTGTGVPPVTLAEWTLQGDGNQDFYDVSLVDGFNVPLSVTNNVGCPTADCPTDLNANCPSVLQLNDTSGAVAGCKTACLANLDGDQTDSANCCSGSHDTAATCPSSGVQFYTYFKDGCPNAYAYAYDESSGTALWTCNSTLAADYTVTFCP